MKITKFDHSCFYLEKDGRGLLFDPVEYDNKLPDFDNIDVIVVTHSHSDHFQPEVLSRIRGKNPNCLVFTAADNVEATPGAGAPNAGDKVTAGVFELAFFGASHAAIVPGQVPCENLCVMVDGVLVNSGDSFDLPPRTPEILLAPVSAPWMKTSEVMEFIKAVRPKVVLPTHDALNSSLGNTIYDNWIRKACEEAGAEYKDTHLGEVA
ncbi:MBL fold metallo-hydrolase [Candidatus Saccharibacteria bacterium]|nr:MBL fold metallo-hydrolase [Candidatus Saccharibacteria bacterium]